MALFENYHVNIFSIVVAVLCIFAIAYFIIVSTYFYNMMKLKPPNKTESSALFWVTIIMALIFAGILAYACYEIWTHKTSIVINTIQPVKPEVTPLVTPVALIAPALPADLPKITPIIPPAPLAISPEIAQTTRIADVSTSLSSLSGTASAKLSEEKLIQNLQELANE